LTALRDKTLLAFSPGKVKAVKIRLDNRQVELEKTASAAWRWPGRETFKVRADRVDSLLRRLDMARIKDFVTEAPSAKELAAYGLAKPLSVVTLEEDKRTETLFLGAPQKHDLYARKGSGGPVFLVEERVKQAIEQTLATLEDRRLWSGDLASVHKVAWGPPDKAWAAVKEEKAWKLTGPGQESLTQPRLLLEMTLQKFQNLEYSRLTPGSKPPDQKTYSLELWEPSGHLLVRMTETGRQEQDQTELNLERQGKFELALVPLKAYQELQADLARLTQELGKAKE
jgi:hypothetical protein